MLIADDNVHTGPPVRLVHRCRALVQLSSTARQAYMSSMCVLTRAFYDGKNYSYIRTHTHTAGWRLDNTIAETAVRWACGRRRCPPDDCAQNYMPKVQLLATW